jgi:demethylmenaquinone methyltransferase/2-methoxy-6-polyprenyl-1,4-benzoquinol methylase
MSGRFVIGNDYQIERVYRTREQARKSYDRISRWYDYVEGSWEKKLRVAGLAQLAAAPGEKILEPGFGTGHSLKAIAGAVGEEGRVYGVDISPRMLQIAQSHLDESGLASRAELQNADATSLPFRDEIMDAVFMSFTLELFDTPEIPVVLGECMRVLRPGGRVCIVALSKSGPSRTMKSMYEWGHRKFPALLDCRPIFAGHSLEAAGFTLQVSILKTIWGLPVEIVEAHKNNSNNGGEKE